MPRHLHRRVRKNRHGGENALALDGEEFIGCFWPHLLPSAFKRTQHYALMVPAAKAIRMAIARNLLEMPQPTTVVREQATDFMRCVNATEIECCPYWQRSRRPLGEQRTKTGCGTNLTLAGSHFDRPI
jgi:hypothetical protein